MSKRINRRMAVVAGAALAVGSMAPAMAQRIHVDGTGSGTGSGTVDVSVETLDVAEFVDLLEPTVLLPADLVINAAGNVGATVDATAGLAVNGVQRIVVDASCLAEAGLDATAAVRAGALARTSLRAGLGGVNAGGAATVAGVVNASSNIAGDVTECAYGLIDGVVDTAGDVKLAANAAVSATVNAALTAVVGAGLPTTVFNAVNYLLVNDVLKVTASGSAQANTNVVAGLLASL